MNTFETNMRDATSAASGDAPKNKVYYIADVEGTIASYNPNYILRKLPGEDPYRMALPSAAGTLALVSDIEAVSGGIYEEIDEIKDNYNELRTDTDEISGKVDALEDIVSGTDVAHLGGKETFIGEKTFSNPILVGDSDAGLSVTYAGLVKNVDGAEHTYDLPLKSGQLALNSDLSDYRAASAQDSIDAAQDAAIAAKYTKPSGGIPASDLASGAIPVVPVKSVKRNGMTITPDAQGAVDVEVPLSFDRIVSQNGLTSVAARNDGSVVASPAVITISGGFSGTVIGGTEPFVLPDPARFRPWTTHYGETWLVQDGASAGEFGTYSGFAIDVLDESQAILMYTVPGMNPGTQSDAYGIAYISGLDSGSPSVVPFQGDWEDPFVFDATVSMSSGGARLVASVDDIPRLSPPVANAQGKATDAKAAYDALALKLDKTDVILPETTAAADKAASAKLTADLLANKVGTNGNQRINNGSLTVETSVKAAIIQAGLPDRLCLKISSDKMTYVDLFGNEKVINIPIDRNNETLATTDDITQGTAVFRGSFATKAALDAVQWQTSDPSGANFVSNNDYAVVLDDETHSDECWRYLYVVSSGSGSWTAQYRINESPLTQAQQDALNSGVTSAVVSHAESAVQPSALSAYRAASAQDSIDAAQDAAIAAKYTKPSGGIPASDLAPGVIPTSFDRIASSNGRSSVTAQNDGSVVVSKATITIVGGFSGTIIGGSEPVVLPDPARFRPWTIHSGETWFVQEGEAAGEFGTYSGFAIDVVSDGEAKLVYTVPGENPGTQTSDQYIMAYIDNLDDVPNLVPTQGDWEDPFEFDATVSISTGSARIVASVDDIPTVVAAKRNMLDYADGTTLVPGTAVYRSSLREDGTFPEITDTAIPTISAYYMFEMEVTVPSTVPPNITGPTWWTWIDGHGLPDPADLSGGETIYVSVRMDCAARTFLASVWRVA